MNRLAKNKLEAYKGWKKIEKSTNNILINKVTGQEDVVVSASEFSRKYNLEQSHLSKLLSGKRKSCGDWIVKDRVIVPDANKGKVYWLISPEGKDVKINNLKSFAKENDLEISCLRQLVIGKALTHKGWLRYGTDAEFVHVKWREKYDVRTKTYHFLNPQNEPVVIHNMSKFCRENNLTKQNMIAVANGRAIQHKGWKLAVLLS